LESQLAAVPAASLTHSARESIVYSVFPTILGTGAAL
jgi:hypothetical protein